MNHHSTIFFLPKKQLSLFDFQQTQYILIIMSLPSFFSIYGFELIVGSTIVLVAGVNATSNIMEAKYLRNKKFPDGTIQVQTDEEIQRYKEMVKRGEGKMLFVPKSQK